MECLNCGFPDFKLVSEPFKVEMDGYDVWMKGECWFCVICGEVMMDSDQMNEFLRRYREKYGKRQVDSGSNKEAGSITQRVGSAEGEKDTGKEIGSSSKEAG